jgi:lipopolysaccharide transport system ATP-binding protein
MPAALRTEGLGKRYRIGSVQPGHGRLTESLANAARATLRVGRGNRNGEAYIWALRDVSLEVGQGEVLGIIGRNGAGKTTLLKVLAEITEPTEGRVAINGRVGSLLEVGTGFHPDLTGRENILLNGAILGMRRREILKKFAQIVEFAEIGPFLDTPVKRYSSGMYVRLAFAVAAHLEPEVLIVDEVLAVGDAAFQKKCIGKIGEVARAGLTVLFVSHNMATVTAFCQRACWLDAGRIVDEGRTQDVVERYLASLRSNDSVPLSDRQDRSGDGTARLTSLAITPAEGGRVIRSSSRLKLTIGYRAETPIQHPRFMVGVEDHRGIGVCWFDSQVIDSLPDVLPAEGIVTCITDSIKLNAGQYNIHIALQRGGAAADYITDAGSFEIVESDVYGSGRVPPSNLALLLPSQEWSIDG